MIPTRAREAPLETEAGKNAFLRLVNDGPLARIFADERLRLTPAKGARRFREDDKRQGSLYDQTYFFHALNVATTAGILFECATQEHRDGAATDPEMRTVMAAGALHDFNKLPFSQDCSVARSLEQARSDAERLLGDYVEQGYIETVFHLAIDTEAGTSRDASEYALSMSPRRATLAALCLQLADQLVGSDADPNDPEGYKAKIQRFRDQHEGFRELPDIHVQPFVLVPQLMLAREARNLFIEWIREHGTLLHESERYVSWIGEKPAPANLAQLAEGLWTRIKPEPEAAFDMTGYQGNRSRVRDDWTAFLVPTPEIVDRWIEHGKNRLLPHQGEWLDQHADQLSKDFPELFKPDRKGHLDLELPARDDSASSEYQHRRRLAKLIIAHAVIQALTEKGKRAPPNDSEDGYDAKSATGVMQPTAYAILWARAEARDDSAYDRACERLARLLRDRRGAWKNPVEGFVEALLGQAPSLSAGATGSGCIYCAAASSDTVEESKVFGIQPTHWASRKEGVQHYKHGVICSRCWIENLLRAIAARDSAASRSAGTFLTIHIHAADLVCDIRWDALTPLLNSEVADESRRFLVLGPKNRRQETGLRMPLRGHYSLPIPKPAGSKEVSDTLAFLMRLRDCLAFIRHTGFKLHISPLTLVPTQQRPQFFWENPPAWMKALGLAEVHVDELLTEEKNGRSQPGKLDIVKALIQVGRIPREGGQQPRAAHTTLVANLALDPHSIYSFRQEPTQEIDSLEAMFVSKDSINRLETIAEAYCAFNEQKTWREQSRNHWTWATRTALDVMESAFDHFGDGGLENPELRDAVVAAVWREAERKNPYARMEEVEKFVDALLTFLTVRYENAVPRGSQRKWLIDAIRYRCQKEYLSRVPEEQESDEKELEVAP